MEDKKKDNTTTSSLNEKLQHFIEEGLSIEDACSILNLDIDSAKLALAANDITDEINACGNETKDILRVAKPKALKALISIGLDKRIDNVSARVAALRSIAEFDEDKGDINKNKIGEIYRKMQEVAKKYDEELRAVKESKEITTVVIDNKHSTTATSVINKTIINNSEELVTI